MIVVSHQVSNFTDIHVSWHSDNKYICDDI